MSLVPLLVITDLEVQQSRHPFFLFWQPGDLRYNIRPHVNLACLVLKHLLHVNTVSLLIDITVSFRFTIGTCVIYTTRSNSSSLIDRLSYGISWTFLGRRYISLKTRIPTTTTLELVRTLSFPLPWKDTA